jgi:hypothetical protein
MGIIEKFFPAKAAVTSAAIIAETERAQGEIASIRTKLAGVMAGIATMSDEQHVAAEATAPAMRRSIARLEARIAALDAELPAVIAAEEAAAKAERDAALAKRAKTATKAVTGEAKALLERYDVLASEVASIFERLEAIDSEAAETNAQLRANRVAEDVPSVTQTWRKAPDQQAGVRTVTAPCWVYTIRHAETREGGKWGYHDEEVVRPATLDNGKPVPIATPVASTPTQTVTTPRIEQREIVVSRRAFRPGRAEVPLSGIHLPSAFAGGEQHWPRS